MKKLWEKLIFISVSLPIGYLLGIIFRILCLFRIIKVSHWERFPHFKGRLVLVSNHPSLLEPILLPALFFWEYLFHPFKLAPWSTPDKQNYYDKWYWFWLRPRAIPIERRDPGGKARALVKMIRVLKKGGIIILFPEGGRTFKGERFHFSKKENKKIRDFEGGIGWIVAKTGATVLPVWVDGADNVLPNSPDKLYHTFPRIWRRTIIKIGEPIEFVPSEHPSSEERRYIEEKIRDTLLELADE